MRIYDVIIRVYVVHIRIHTHLHVRSKLRYVRLINEETRTQMWRRETYQICINYTY